MIQKCLNGIFLLFFLTAAAVMLLFLPGCFKLMPQIVLSGSMEPVISVGSLAYIRESVRPEEIRENDIIVYDMGESTKVLHRVIEVDDGNRTFQTKGDANQEPDLGKVEFSRYRGKEVFSIPYAGYLLHYLQNRKNKIWIMMTAVCLLTAEGIRKLVERRKTR